MAEKIVRRKLVDLPFPDFFLGKLSEEHPDDLTFGHGWIRWYDGDEDLKIYTPFIQEKEVQVWPRLICHIAKVFGLRLPETKIIRKVAQEHIAWIRFSPGNTERKIYLKIWSETWHPILKGVVEEYGELTAEDYRPLEVDIKCTFTTVISKKRKRLEDNYVPSLASDDEYTEDTDGEIDLKALGA